MAELIMLMGIPSCGKSTLAKEIIELYKKDRKEYLYLSSDKIREELYGDEAIQGDPAEVFYLMQERTIYSLIKGIDIIYDATNLSRKRRIAFLNSLPVGKKDVPHNRSLYFKYLPLEDCIERDKLRDRVVGEEVIKRMVRSFDAPNTDEGWDNVAIIKESSMIELSIEEVLKEGSFLDISHDSSHHRLSILEHIKETKRLMEVMTKDKDLINAAALHDIGKPFTKSFKNSKGEITSQAHYYDHQKVGAYLSYQYKDVSGLSSWLISCHMEPYFNSKYYRKLLNKDRALIDILNKADCAAH